MNVSARDSKRGSKGCKCRATERVTLDWYSDSEGVWNKALAGYWADDGKIREENRELERSLDKLDRNRIAEFDAEGWYHFLRDEYFKWKYTAPNRYATTTKFLKYYEDSDDLEALDAIRMRLLALDVKDVLTGLKIAKEIKGLGVAGASGLLALMYPTAFATVDQFVVKALMRIPGLPEHDALRRIKENCISLKAGVLLIGIMQRKAEELNRKFTTNAWTPRRIDMILWAAERTSCTPTV